MSVRMCVCVCVYVCVCVCVCACTCVFFCERRRDLQKTPGNSSRAASDSYRLNPLRLSLAGLLFLLDVLPCVLQSLLIGWRFRIGCFFLFFCESSFSYRIRSSASFSIVRSSSSFGTVRSSSGQTRPRHLRSSASGEGV